ncbi:protein adenylyltransferase SelO [Sporosarcina aquimarina]|uniref:Protein nucleotidyltransferase YdiU n=1 Tax=Sporosarcina aquimarina TaxID=114975 RepID=A0ABU4FYN0_9BACL|nr:YdiU family protein [Sporosarcina aquimarina]MDW0109828.1 YdiU family protein [Sporosarcina aquimarina]
MSLEQGWNLDNSYCQLPEVFFAETDPEKAVSPKVVLLNKNLAESLGLQVEKLNPEVLSGSELPERAEPIAQAYAGHQFGNFTMLGDGRAILLGEQITPSGERIDIGLKGSGSTAFSRGGDGLAGLGPMLREYIISEAMHALGIPTSRSLSVTLTGNDVYREDVLPGAVLIRTASSYLRVGTFQYAAARQVTEDLGTLADYAIERHYPEAATENNRYELLLANVIERQAALVAKWQLVGFIHGVMNTDNVTISGETIDYGPCAFMDEYDPETVFSSIDVNGRYKYGNQPGITSWNLARFAETLLPLLDKNQDTAIQIAEKQLAQFGKVFEREWLNGMRAKLGLLDEKPEDEALAKELLLIMKDMRADYTNTFRALTEKSAEQPNWFAKDAFRQWRVKWDDRRNQQVASAEASYGVMRLSNPVVIPRNHRVEEAIKAAENGDLSVLHKLNQVLSTPYASSKEQDPYTRPSISSAPYQTYCGT